MLCAGGIRGALPVALTGTVPMYDPVLNTGSLYYHRMDFMSYTVVTFSSLIQVRARILAWVCRCACVRATRET